MAQVPAVDLAGSVVHEIRQDIVFKPVIPEVGRIEPSHFQCRLRFLEIGDHGAEIEERVADADVQQMLAQKQNEILNHRAAAQLRSV